MRGGSAGAAMEQESRAGGDGAAGFGCLKTEGDGPKELGKQPGGKKSRIRDARRKKTPGAVWQAQRRLAASEAGGGQEPQQQFLERRGRWLDRRYSPHCRDERQERKGNTLGVEKPLAAKTVLLVNWQQANTLITS